MNELLIQNGLFSVVDPAVDENPVKCSRAYIKHFLALQALQRSKFYLIINSTTTNALGKFHSNTYNKYK